MAKSSYYASKCLRAQNRNDKEESIKDNILRIWKESKKRYGAPKIHKKLEIEGISISERTISRYMSELGIHSIIVKKYRPHSGKTAVVERDNLLAGNFTTTGICEKWCTDITYIHTLKDGWTYLASVLDLHSRKIVGYAYARTMTTELAIQAVRNALTGIQMSQPIILHSDLGSQYTSDQFMCFAASKGLIQSFSGKGNPYHNAPMESFHSILKREEVHQHHYFDFETAQREIFEYIEGWYNRKRIHGAIGYKTPQQAHQLSS